MSDQATASSPAPVAENYIPDESEVQQPQTGGAYRISEGKIQRGRKEDNTVEERERIVGRLQRFAVQDGSGDNGAYSFLEAEIETAQGPVRVHTNLLDKGGNLKPSAACVSFAEGLLQFEVNELLILTARQSFKVNKYGTYSTYANLFHLKPGETRGRETTRRKWPEETPFDQMWPVLLAELKAHPAWKVRERAEADAGPTHLSMLCKECEAKGWPTPNQAPGAWLARMAELAKHPVKAKLTDYPDDNWGDVRQAIATRTEIPAFLVEAQKLLNPAQAPTQAGFDNL